LRQRNPQWVHSMRAIPPDRPPADTSGPAGPEGFWQYLAKVLEAYFVGRMQGAVSARLLRRSSYELARCRRLMHRSGALGESGFHGRPGSKVDHAQAG
jgi:hypothetical protein